MNLLLIRLIIFAVLFFAGLRLYRMYREWKLDHEAPDDTSQLEGGQMVRCAWCQVHLPQADALHDHGDWFCSSAHRDRFLQEQDPDK